MGLYTWYGFSVKQLHPKASKSSQHKVEEQTKCVARGGVHA